MTSKSDKSTPTDWSLARRVWPYMLPAKRWLFVVAVVMPVGVLIELVQPILLKRAIDDGIDVGDRAVLLIRRIVCCLSHWCLRCTNARQLWIDYI